MTKSIKRVKVFTSFPLQALLLAASGIEGLFLLFTIGCYIYKLVRFIYPVYAWILELIGILAYGILIFGALKVASIGNFKEQVIPIGIAIIFYFIMILFNVYLMVLQVYVLSSEFYINIIMIVLKLIVMIIAAVVGILMLRKRS
mmetsp:Transcript_2441/g.3554  ORF Transcript_2441/g.3554 Transcript_2441/m.3554 type:complete len:144 (+) Transcript_2441:2016-2447(+)